MTGFKPLSSGVSSNTNCTTTTTKEVLREVVVAQLVELSLSIPEVHGSTPVIGKILLNICLLSTVLKRRK